MACRGDPNGYLGLRGLGLYLPDNDPLPDLAILGRMPPTWI
jgi:hypothetical protein